MFAARMMEKSGKSLACMYVMYMYFAFQKWDDRVVFLPLNIKRAQEYVLESWL